MIEIRELVIRATVEDTPRKDSGRIETDQRSGRTGKKDCCQDTIDMMLQIINDKKER